MAVQSRTAVFMGFSFYLNDDKDGVGVSCWSLAF